METTTTQEVQQMDMTRRDFFDARMRSSAAMRSVVRQRSDAAWASVAAPLDHQLAIAERAPITPSGMSAGLDAIGNVFGILDAAYARQPHRQAVERDDDGNERMVCTCGDRSLWSMTVSAASLGRKHAEQHA